MTLFATHVETCLCSHDAFGQKLGETMPNRGTNVFKVLLPLHPQHRESDSALDVCPRHSSRSKNGADDANHNEAKQSEKGSSYRRR